MSIERVREYFSQLGMEDRILEFPVSSATVELAAQAVGVDGCRIAKTLSRASVPASWVMPSAITLEC